MADERTTSLMVGGELMLYGDVGGDFFEGGFTAADVRRALAGVRGDLTVRLNSGGGLAFDGRAIYNALREHDGTIAVVVDGIAASAASIIAMAGETIALASGAMMMIHDPSALTVGTAAAHQRTARVLDSIAASAAAIYARRSHQPLETIRGLMTAETWFTAEEAVGAGFADEALEIEAQPAMRFDYDLYLHAPEHLARPDPARLGAARKKLAAAHERSLAQGAAGAVSAVMGAAFHQEESDMDEESETVATDVVETAPPPAREAAREPVREAAHDPSADARAAAAGERSRIKAIMSMCERHNVGAELRERLVAGGSSLAAAREAVLDHLATESDRTAPRSHVRVGDDEADRFRMGAERALAAKSGLEGGERNEFSGLTLAELARESLARANVSTRGMDRLSMVGRAFLPRMSSAGYHTTSDFAALLENTANKSLLRGYQETEETWQRFARPGFASDFKPMKRVGLNAFPSLQQIPEHGEYHYGSIGERYGIIKVDKFGLMFGISREAIINDDLSEFTRVPEMMGRAAQRTVGDVVYALITTNPVFVDGIAMFHADHGNLADTPAAPTMVSLDTARSAMALQRDPSGNAVLNIRPSVALVPVALYGTFRALIDAEFDPSKTQRAPNIVRSMVRDVVADARLDTASTTAWYLMADPAMHDTIEVAFLDGRQEPFLEMKDGWTVDGVEYKVRHEFGAAPLDTVGMFKNAGQ